MDSGVGINCCHLENRQSRLRVKVMRALGREIVPNERALIDHYSVSRREGEEKELTTTTVHCDYASVSVRP